ncbi:hypothetical protein, partial [Vibrio parahaemolyticus]|uniref:hypothetical protein n=1 Tax=Vibrio parahaemolyticus TaxID=670 RepID=UPI001BB09F80
MIFTSFTHDRGIELQSNDLTIPRKHQQKKLVLNEGLAPFNQNELKNFYSTAYMQAESRQLWADLALLCGLRAFEVTLLRETEIVDIDLDETKVYAVDILGKLNKYRQILIPRSLMSHLWEYKNSPERMKRAA